jgi:hypothetical protein
MILFKKYEKKTTSLQRELHGFKESEDDTSTIR